MLTMTVFITTRFAAAHRWKDAPDQYPLLRNFHRHEFHVRLDCYVQDANREIEFIDLKRRVQLYIYNKWEGRNDLELSCEEFATRLLREFAATRVEVSEDGENGAVVYGSA